MCLCVCVCVCGGGGGRRVCVCVKQVISLLLVRPGLVSHLSYFVCLNELETIQMVAKFL